VDIDEDGVPISLGILGLIFVLAPLAGYIELHISVFLLALAVTLVD
jgi:hypothetical protein